MLACLGIGIATTLAVHGADRASAPALHRRRGDASRRCARAMEQRRVTSRELVQQCLAADRDLRGAAERRDRGEPERAARRPRPATASARRARCAGRCTASRSRSRTTSTPPTCRRPAARSRSTGLVPPYDATLTKNLRDAGAVIIAKTVMTELANWVRAPACPATTARWAATA
ncbi:MAG: amidase family protein [Comamonadaceae bacterium]|nr:amidase family protein [Comamonadaceae bacterium]